MTNCPTSLPTTAPRNRHCERELSPSLRSCASNFFLYDAQWEHHYCMATGPASAEVCSCRMCRRARSRYVLAVTCACCGRLTERLNGFRECFGCADRIIAAKIAREDARAEVSA